MDMFDVLSGGPYYVFGRPLLLKIMPEVFDFDTSDMVWMPVQAKLASESSPPGANPFAPPQVVHVSEGRFDATVELPPRRQYLTRSRVVAPSTFGRSMKPLGMSSHPSKSSSLADSKTQGNTTSTPSSSL
uniref:DUF4283 domain-containing protein n=1 Tax=Populus alba TaxID=43335 RepID=A0A4U5P5J9_POPAL|nr:hypothetical protein D5086_0000222180 [Populus alba]